MPRSGAASVREMTAFCFGRLTLQPRHALRHFHGKIGAWENGWLKTGSRYSCYLRLAYGLAKHSSFAGLVRIEVSDSIEVEEARKLADACAIFLPKFATPYGRDPRAPSNLLPLAALENQLKHQMGDLKLIQRVLEEQFY